VPKGAALADLVVEHYGEMLRFYGTALGLRVARKHLGWYMDHCNTPAGLRRMVLTETDPKRVVRLLPEALCGVTEAVA
jgi:tRNA-dihydrouridine synthase